MDMLDLRRLRGLLGGLGLVAALAVAFTLLCVPVVLRTWLNRLERFNRTSPLTSYDTFGRKLAAMTHQGWGNPGREKFGLVLGSSQCYDGIDTSRLASAPGSGVPRWAAGTGLGVTPVDLAIMIDLMFRTPIRPSRVLIGLDRGSIARVNVEHFWYFEQPAPRREEVLEHLHSKQPLRLLGDLKQELKHLYHEVLPYREASQRYFPIELFTLRLRLFAWLGVSPVRLFARHEDPWLVKFGSGPPLPPDEAENQRLLANQLAMGRYNPENYSTDGPNVQALIQTIRRLREAGIDVLLVMLPEESRIRERVPEKSTEVLRSALESAFGKDVPPMLDYRTTVPDNEFEDVLHVNPAGRARVAELLLEALPPPR